MLAFSVNEERVALQFKIRVFANSNEMINRLITNLNNPSAFTALYLDAGLFTGYKFVQRRRLASLPLDGMQDVRLDEQLQIIIDRSFRDTLFEAFLRQLVGGERLR